MFENILNRNAKHTESKKKNRPKSFLSRTKLRESVGNAKQSFFYFRPELIVYQSSCRLCYCKQFQTISTTSGPMVTKFYLNHHWGGGKAALGFGPDQIGTLVSMATDSSHRVIMGKMLSAL